MIKATLRNSQSPVARGRVTTDVSPTDPPPPPPSPSPFPARRVGKVVDVESLVTGVTDVTPLPKEPPPEEPPRAMTVARRPSLALAPVAPGAFASEGVQGDWSYDDLKFPQLKLVQGSGPLSVQFDNGTILYGDDELLPPPSSKAGAANTLIRFAPVSMNKQFREKLTEEEVKGGAMARIANSDGEVRELGGTTRWSPGGNMPDNYWEPSARCILLLEKPAASEHPGFALDLDAKQYGVAVYYAAGGAFREFAKRIFNTAQTSLLVPVLDEAGQPAKSPTGRPVKRVLLYRNWWTLTFAKKQAGNFTPWRPVAMLSRDETSEDVRSYCSNLNGEAAEQASEPQLDSEEA